MNKYSLQFNSREFEFAFLQNEKENTRYILKIGTIINIIQSVVLITYYFIEDAAQSTDRIIAIAFFSIGVVSWAIKILSKKFQRLTNTLLFIKNCLLCLIVGIQQLTMDQNHKHAYMNYQPLLGVLFIIEILTSLQGTNFIYKILLCAINLILLGFAFYGEKSTCLIISMAFGILYFLSYIYLNDKLKRDLFLDKQKSIELSFLIDKLLPINIVVMKYNPKEERSFLHQVNRKAQNTFNISDNDAFKEFSKRVMIKQESNQEEEERTQNDLNEVQGEKEERTLFFYLESIAKENYDRQKKDKNKSSSPDKRQSLQKSERNSRLVTRNERVGSISKVQRNKMNSLFERPQKLSDDIKYNDRVNSGEKDRMQRYSVFEPSKVSSIERNKNNSIERPKMGSIERPKGVSIERTIIGSIEKASHHSGDKNRAANNSMERDKSKQNIDERSKKISFEKDRANNTPVHVRSSKRSSTVKIDNTTGNAASGGGPIGAVGGKFVRRVQKKGTIMRKVSNFNLKSGVANSKVKYGEDVYDRIDIFTGTYTEKDGNQRFIQIKIYTYNVNEQYQVILIEDETLEGQVKYLSELNKFLYKSFQESLEQFRMPLAYSLIKLNNTYEQVKQGKDERQSPTSCTNLNQNQTNYNKTEGHRQSFSQIQQSEFSQTNISPISKHRYVTTNNSIFYSNINNQFNRNPENFSAINQDTQFSQSMNNLQQYLQDNPSSRRRAYSHSDSLDKIYESVDNTRYYGFITLNSIYNYIDYIALLQKKQLELRVTEISIKRVIQDVLRLVENQAQKKQVKIKFINELKYDRLTSDERRIKQLLLNFLISILHKTQMGYIILRASSNVRQLETIKISIYNSGNYTYPIQHKARFKLNSINDIIHARKNKDCLEQAINSQIIGKIGPYDRITVTNGDKAGSTVSFQIYTDLNILNLPHKFQSVDDVDLQFQSAFKSIANIPQEGDISDNSSYDMNFNMNKLLVENFNQIQNKSFYQFQDIATLNEREDQTHQISSKNQPQNSQKPYLLLEIQNDRSNQNSSFQESPLHPVTYNAVPQSYEPSFQQNTQDQYKKNLKNLDDVINGYDANNVKSEQSKYIDQNDNQFEEDSNGYDEENQSYEYENGFQNNNSNWNKKQNSKRNKNNESVFSQNSRENKVNTNSYRNKQDSNSKRMITSNNNKQSNRQYDDQRIKAVETSKCYMINSAVAFDQNDENYSPRLNMETTQAMQSQQVLQPFPSSKNNNQKQIFFTEVYEGNPRQKQNYSYETMGYQYEDKNETKITLNQFSSRQLNQYPNINNNNNDDHHQNVYYPIQQQNIVNKQKANIIKLQQSSLQNDNYNNEQPKLSNINITSLNHIS